MDLVHERRVFRLQGVGTKPPFIPNLHRPRGPGEMTTFAALRALHTLIGDALSEIEHVYRSPLTGNASLDYPSLDVPYYENKEATASLEEELTSDPAVVTAADKIVAACGQIAATVHKPYFQLCEATMGEILTSCISFVEATHTVEILRAAGKDGLHVRDIAASVDDLRRAVGTDIVPLDPGKLGHILRLLATHHWFREVRTDVFANNRLSAQVDSGKTLDQLRTAPQTKYDDTDGVAALVSMRTDEFYKAVTHLIDHLLPERERSVSTRKLLDAGLQTPAAASAKYQTPFNLAFRTELGYFDWLELPENKRRLTNFGRAMTAVRAWEVAEHIINAFPWKDLPKDSVVVDVGGGIGSTSMVLAKAFPHLRFVVQDRPKVVEAAPSYWNKSSGAEFIDSGRVSFMAQSFFDPQPAALDVPGIGPVPTPAVYLIRGCVHNWPDEPVLKMLGLLRDKAAPTTQLLIADTVLPYACVDDTDDAEPIPGAVRTLVPGNITAPLLANLGKAKASPYQLDITMMAVLDAKERTIREVAALASTAGWKVTGTTRGAGSLWGYTAAKPI